MPEGSTLRVRKDAGQSRKGLLVLAFFQEWSLPDPIATFGAGRLAHFNTPGIFSLNRSKRGTETPWM